ncbi:hypothetical protein MTR67_013496 [Solanum verrucosum]|uniref:Uncharacterized protein n=1 Tax=Solanum verrucosum TaxID=315347 RepID=A0AAF0QGE1_SOLVR|nr:hypothetical protein MTR67_013496 [Solanum verrucosum]
MFEISQVPHRIPSSNSTRYLSYINPFPLTVQGRSFLRKRRKEHPAKFLGVLIFVTEILLIRGYFESEWWWSSSRTLEFQLLPRTR